MKWIVGARVVVTDVNRDGPRDYVITKIGRKYFTLDDGRQYEIETGSQTGDYQHRQAYLPEEYEQRCRATEALINLRAMGVTLNRNFSSDIVIAIHSKISEILS